MNDQQGPRGATGPQGPRGIARLSRSATYALAGLAAVVLVIVACALLLGFRSVQQAHHGEQLAQQALAKISHHNALCVAIGQLVAEQPPSGSAAANPSRAYEQNLYATLVQLHKQLGCNK